MAAPDAVSGTAVARAEVRKSLDRMDYHLKRGVKGAKGVSREMSYLDALHRQTVRMSGVAAGIPYAANPAESFGKKAAAALSTSDSRTVGRMKSSVLADFSADGLAPTRDWTHTNLDPWVWTANGSACPSCLSRHGKKEIGPFIPMHPSCLCIPTMLHQAGGIRPLTQDELIDTAREYGDPRYFKKLADLEKGTIDLDTLAAVENVNQSARGMAEVFKHFHKGEVQQGVTPRIKRHQRRADPDRHGSTTEYWTDEAGVWDPERQQLHDNIVRKFIDEADLGDPPEFQMMGGGPASGKSTMLEAPDSPVLRGRKAVQIDTDEIKKLLPEYDDMVKAGNKEAAAFSHQESSYISKRILSEVDELRSVVLDGTGDGGWEAVAKKVRQARARKQKVTANYATNDVELASKLSYERGLKTGRSVPDGVLRNIHADVTDTFFDSLEKGLFDDAFLMDTNIHHVPRSILSFTDDGFVIHDEALLKDFLAKSRTGKWSLDDVKALGDDLTKKRTPGTRKVTTDAHDFVGDDLVALRRAEAKYPMEDVFKAVNTTEDDFIKAYQKALDEATVNINIDSGNLGKVLDQGRFKTQFETDSSGGTLDNVFRARQEATLFGQPQSIEPSKRAVYGWIGDAKDASRVEWYGNTVVSFKNEIKKATTMTGTDSLGTTVAVSPLDDLSAASFDWSSIARPFSSSGRAERSGSYTHRLRKELEETLIKPNLNDVPGGSYAEVQIHGGEATVDLIAHVRFTGYVDKTVTARLDALGIPWGT